MRGEADAMAIQVTPSGEACGAHVTGVDLTQPLTSGEVAEVRAAWLEHHVLAFPRQAMNEDDLERFTLYFGPFGDDPFIGSIDGRPNIIAVKRMADETSPLFAENWHSDWSFQADPPAGTCLFGIIIPPVGGNTQFANQHQALDEMPPELRAKVEGKLAIHSASSAYAPVGAYGTADTAHRSMDIRPSEEAWATQLHPIIRAHPETHRLGIFSTAGYITGFEGMPELESRELLVELYHWQTKPQFVYDHKWEPNMLVMWDNRSLLHRATGGYDGYARLLHRTTIGAA